MKAVLNADHFNGEEEGAIDCLLDLRFKIIVAQSGGLHFAPDGQWLVLFNAEFLG